MTAQLGQILTYMELLDEVDTDQVEPMAHAVEVSDVFRGDQVGPSLARDCVLANAPGTTASATACPRCSASRNSRLPSLARSDRSCPAPRRSDNKSSVPAIADLPSICEEICVSLTDLTALELLDRLDAKEVTSTEVAEAFLDRIERYDRRIGAFLRVDREAALAQAAAIDNKRRRGEALGRLGGLPVAIKDLLATKGEPTTCASRMLENFRPPYDATVIARLKAADGVILGKTNMDEFAMGGSTENSAFQLTRTPGTPPGYPAARAACTAAAVAAAMAPCRSLPTPAARSAPRPAGAGWSD